MEINKYQQKVLLEMLKSRYKDEQHIIDKLTQTVKHNEEWAMPIAKSTGDERIVKGMFEVVRYAKRDIEINKNDLEQIKDLMEKIKNLAVN
jgi:predicted AAA+ superfamily ATPase